MRCRSSGRAATSSTSSAVSAQRQADLIGPEDALLAVSYTPYAGETLASARAAFERGVPVVGITDSPFSPLVQVSHVWLEVAEADYSGFPLALGELRPGDDAGRGDRQPAVRRPAPGAIDAEERTYGSY